MYYAECENCGTETSEILECYCNGIDCCCKGQPVNEIAFCCQACEINFNIKNI